MLTQIDIPSSPERGLPVFRAGFRPFFLLAGILAAVVVPVWLAQAIGGWGMGLPYPPVLWHGHEMVFGVAAAAVAGFLLTAVPNWTGAPNVKGAPLAALTGLWLAARLAFALGAVLPTGLAALLDLPFLPALAVLLARPLIGAGTFRNMAFLPILGVLTVADGLVLAEMAGIGSMGRSGLTLGIFVLLTMIAVIGGRIIPGFTQGGLSRIGVTVRPKSHRWLELSCIAGIVAVAVMVLVLPGSVAAGVVAIVAAVLHIARMAGWYGWKTGRVPLLWVLHLGYAWLPLGLMLLGLSSFVPAAVTPQIALHALTVGCIGTMILGVMSRAALGHSGRLLVPARLTVVAYVLVGLSAVVRVFGVMVDPVAALWLSAALWSSGFAMYAVVYAPVCLLPRRDGRPG